MENTITVFPNVNPINDITKALALNICDDCARDIRLRKEPMEQIQKPKNLAVVRFSPETVWNIRQELGALGLKLCLYAPNFLFGLMALVSEESMPPELEGVDILAFDPDNHASLFLQRLEHYTFGPFPIILVRYKFRGKMWRDLQLVTGTIWVGKQRAVLAEQLCPD